MIAFDPVAFGAGALNFALAFIAAGGFTLIFKALYRWITPHDEGALIRAGNSAAAVALEPRMSAIGPTERSSSIQICSMKPMTSLLKTTM